MRRRIELGLLLAMVASCGRCGPSGSGSTGGLTGVDGEASASNLDFGNVPVGQAEGLPLVIKNTGDSSLDISRLALSGANAGDFVIGTNAATSLAASQTTSIGVRFTPSVAGPRTATVTIFTDSGTKPDVIVTLTGNGTQIGLSVTPEPVDFGTVQVGAAPATVALQLGNTGNLALTLTAGALTGSQASWFSVGPGFGALAPGATQSVTLTFTPPSAGAATADLPIQACSGSGTANCSNLSVTLQGTGVDSQLVYNPDPVAFAMVPSGNSVPQTVTLTNNGSADISVTQIVTQSGASVIFDLQSLPNSLPVDVPAGQGLTFTVMYTPSGNPSDTDAIVTTYLASDQVTRTASDPLTGGGVVSPCSLTVAPTSLTFASVAVGTAVNQQVTLTNSGATACQLSAIQLDPSSDPGYALASGTTATLTVPASGSAQIGVQYLLPSEASPYTRLGTLTFATSDLNLPTGSVPLTANLDMSAFPCTMTVSPTTLYYGYVTVGTLATLSSTFTNTGTTACNITDVALDPTSDPSFSVDPAQAVSFTIPVGGTATLTADVDLNNDNLPNERTGAVDFQSNDPTQANGAISLLASLETIGSTCPNDHPNLFTGQTDQGGTCTSDADCTTGLTCNSSACWLTGETSPIQVVLSWDYAEDLDLHVVEPQAGGPDTEKLDGGATVPGCEIFYDNGVEGDGNDGDCTPVGELNRDAQAACTSEDVNVEEVTYPVGKNPPAGWYTVRADFWSDCDADTGQSHATIPYVVQVRIGGFLESYCGTFTKNQADRGGEGSGVQIFQFQILADGGLGEL